MPVQFVNPETGDFVPGALENTGAPSRYGITTPEQLVSTSLSTTQGDQGAFTDIFFANTPIANL